MKITLYHGGETEIQKPDLNHSRTDIDFGRGFYLTEDKEMACKWAARKKEASVVNTYELELDGLNVYRFGLNETWLRYVSGNRGCSEQIYDDSGYDVIAGPTADDRLFVTVQNYLDGNITAERALKQLDIVGYALQFTLKTHKALDNLSFVQSAGLQPEEIAFWKSKAKIERLEALRKIDKMQRTENGRRRVLLPEPEPLPEEDEPYEFKSR